MKAAGRTRRKMIITTGGECKFLFLIVNATILVILSTRQRVSSAAVATSATLKQAPQHQQQVAMVANSAESGLSKPIANNKPASERNNSRSQQSTSTTTSSTTSSPTTPTSQSARLSAPTGQALETNALVYLQRYGYMQAPPAGAETSNNLISEESFSQAIAEFQRFAGLNETGQVDKQTLDMMRMPRCGNTDKPTTATISKSGQLINRSWLLQGQSNRGSSWSALKRRRKRYALQGSKWRRQELTYRISQYPTKFVGRRHEVDSQIEKAFGIWTQVAPIDFVVKKEGRVHIDIRFASGDHGDGDAFDGPGNTLAHAYFPQYGGDAHFDDQEYWTVDSYAGTNIFQVAAHELGHSLGLGHSNVREALMAPFYQKYKPNFKLHIDDVLAIQALYGEKAFLPEVPGGDHTASTQRPTTTSTASPTTTTSTTTSTTTTARPSPPTTAFSGRSPPIYRGNRRPPAGARNDDDEPPPPSVGNEPAASDENGNPDLSSNGINGFGPANGAGGSAGADEPIFGGGAGPAADLCSDSAIDAITRTEDGNSYVFKGDHYWLLTNEGLARGYPRRIATDWDGLPGQLDAALTWADGKTFFFKGNKYWRFRNRRRDLGYPKLISAGFAGIPDDIDAAFVWSGNGRTYFFKGADYWRFDSKAEPPVSSEYPRSVKVWLGVPAHINAAFKWDNNVTYFFKGTQYYRFNDREFKVESRGRPAFPRQTSEWWFGCVSSNLAQRVMPAGKVPPPQQQNNPTRTARLHPNPNSRTSIAALQLKPTGASSQDQADWSFLAGLSADQTRSMGTHISDHHQKPSVAPSPASERNWREEETISESDIDRRLVPASSAGGHREPQFEPIDSEQSWRRPATTLTSRIDSDHHARTHTASIQPPDLSSNSNGPHYQTSSSASTAILFATHNSSVIGSWMTPVALVAMILWLGTMSTRHRIVLHQVR